MKRILTILFLMAGLTAFGQTYKTTTSVLNDSTTLFRSGTYTANLDNRYAKIEDGLISGGAATTNGDSLIVASGVARINSANISFTGRLFADIAPSGVGLTRILIIYANTSGTLDSIAGAQSNNPVEPTLPANTQRIVTVNVSDAGLGTPTVDLSGFLTISTDQDVLSNKTFKRPIYSNNDANFGDFYGVNDSGFIYSFYRDIDNNFIFSVYDSSQVSPNVSYDINRSTNILDFKNTPTINGNNLAVTSLGYTPYNPASYPVNLGGETLSSVASRNSISSIGLQAPFFYGGGYTASNDYNNNYKISASFGDLTKGINLGYNTIDDIGFIFSVHNNNSFKPLSLNPVQGNVLVGYNSDQGFKLAVNGTGNFASTLRSTNFGAGISPNINFGFTGAASTTTTAPFLITPGVAYTGTQNGALWYETTNSRLRMYRNSSVSDIVTTGSNILFGGTGVRAVTATTDGSLAATTPIIAQFITDSDIITALGAATYTNNQATITPAGGKIMLQGQEYWDDTNKIKYQAVANNVVLRTPNRILKTYTALVTQTGTGAPTVTVLGENTIGTIVWTRTAAGQYTGTLTGAFTASKTAVFFQSGISNNVDTYTYDFYRGTDNTVRMLTSNNGVYSDSIFVGQLRIEVYF